MRLVPQRKVIILSILLFAVAAGWWLFRGISSQQGGCLTEETRHLWGYSIYADTKLRRLFGELASTYTASKTGRGSHALVFGGATMAWGWHSCSSAWFNFGDMVQGSNLSYWEFALPKSSSVEDALTELPSLKFAGAQSNYWVGQLGPLDTSFQPRSVGLGAISLSTNRTFFARHYQTQDVAYLIQFHSMTPGRFGDVVVRFRHASVRSPPAETHQQ
jgi:hypothetical protein